MIQLQALRLLQLLFELGVRLGDEALDDAPDRVLPGLQISPHVRTHELENNTTWIQYTECPEVNKLLHSSTQPC